MSVWEKTVMPFSGARCSIFPRLPVWDCISAYRIFSTVRLSAPIAAHHFEKHTNRRAENFSTPQRAPNVSHSRPVLRESNKSNSEFRKMSENESSKMRVVVRIRPMSSREIENEEERVIEQIDDKVEK